MNALAPFRRNRSVARRDGAPDAFTDLQRRINELFERDFWDWDVPSLFDEGMTPAIDVKDNGNEVEIRCDLPGVDRKDIDISVSGNQLIIKGEKKDERERNGDNYYRRESWSGTFQRSVTLPESVEPEKADASMKNGVLTLTLPKKEDKRRKKIDVKVK